ncbi:uncharacterized protein DUF2487 [Melghirimyces profundicolus]|uniref:Uncharacterized protein DUF2487 n=1 Tax=Melghirimyces profundicolus TaxID=1242148 RepID=A0A2T6BV19_9BACL|nr:DUF2487 family protein [Melghirimyces profundicolus]PTX59921.1 uncharacterized protein DUF2487 [Melghirimyces profundicolus]
MRLSSLNQADWYRWAPYVDSLLIPLYSVRIPGKQPDLGEAEQIREVADRTERSLTGRLLLLPAIPYGVEDIGLLRRYVEAIMQDLHKSGFHHLFLLAPDFYRDGLKAEREDPWELLTLPPEGRIPAEELAESVVQQIVTHWEQNSRNEERDFRKK